MRAFCRFFGVQATANSVGYCLTAPNRTVIGTGFQSVWCPSDGRITRGYRWTPTITVRFSSCAACTGTWGTEAYGVPVNPGGANFGFADGSLQFLKDPIQSWPMNPSTGYPFGVSENDGVFTLVPGSQVGVYQELTTMAGNEVISSDGY
jgi:prepilin-type processing-associated H-X9-DG protein